MLYRLALTFPAVCLFLFGAALGASQNIAQSAAADVTIRLFFSQNVSSLSISPASPAATRKRCSTCPSKPLNTPLQVIRRNSTMLVNNSPESSLDISGAIKVETSAGRTAVASGHWLLRPHKDGLHLTVTLPSERYVMAVLASEASPDEPAASLQALAIAVRSFALTHLNRHHADGFDLCDSTHCQALRLAPISDSIRAAVDNTAGETIWIHGHRASAYFTQHCGGITEDAAQLWGGPSLSWSASHPDPWCQRTSSSWHASLTQTELQQTLAAAGLPVNVPVSSLQISKRDATGRASVLAIVTTERQIQIPAATFRFAVGRTLGWNRLRSDWYAVSLAGGVAHFDGKGFGHGVGLCQAGAAAMAVQQSAGDRAILKFYFPGTDVRIAASDQGWLNASGHGWTLYNTDSIDTAALLRDGDIAWSHARTLLGRVARTADVSPVSVRVFPTTELFRSATGEPGWVIGATRGNTISLQPLRIVEAHESLNAALLHEMLHVLVERQSRASTPLWMREGFVEVLAAEASANEHVPSPSMPVEAMNAALALPSSYEQSRHAHQAAAAAVHRLIDFYGIAQVRSWLSSGIPGDALAKAGLR